MKDKDPAPDAPMEPSASTSDNLGSDDSAAAPADSPSSSSDGGSVSPPAFHPSVGGAKKDNKKMLMIVAAIVVVLGAAAAAYFMLFNKKSTDTSKTNNSTSTVKETGDIVFGVNTDFTTPATSPFGISIKQGVELAAEEFNAKGGIMGRHVKVVALDDKADVETSKKNAEQLIKVEKVHAIVSPTHATNLLAWMDMAQDSETTVIIPAAPTTGLTQKFAQRPRNYIFRINATDNVFAELNVAWALKQTKNGKVAILAPTTPYGQQGTKDLTDVLGRWGKTPVMTSSFTQGTNIAEITKNLTAIKAAGADAILIHAVADDSVTVLKALDAMKYDPVVVGSSATLSGVVPKTAGALASKLTFPTGVGPTMNERTKDLNARLTAKNGTPTPIFAVAAQAYDAMTLLKAAMEKAGSTDRKAYRDALENLGQVQGVIKLYDKPFTKSNHEGTSPRDLYLAHWVGAQVVPYPSDDMEIR